MKHTESKIKNAKEKLTKLEVENAGPKSEGPYTLADGGGLGLFIPTTGARCWRWRYRFQGKPKTMAFGEFPRVSLKDARSLHSEARKTLASGIDPMTERKTKVEGKRTEIKIQKAEAENTFLHVAKKWWAKWEVGLSPRWTTYMWRILEADVFPAIGEKAIHAVTAQHIQKFMLAVQQRGAFDVARRLHETTGQIFRYAIAHGIATRNPAADFLPGDVLNKRTAGEYARLDEKDLPELLIKMENYRGDTLTRLGLRALKYTFPRPGMLTGSPWTEFDLDRARWDIPKERMKMPTPHIVPLSRQAVEVLRTLQQITGDGEYVFPGTHGNKHMDTNTLLFALYRLGYQGRMTSHGFRGIASTVLNERGFDDKHIEIQLAHLQRNKTKKAYDHAKYLEPRRNLMQWWADFLDEELAKGRKLVTAH